MTEKDLENIICMYPELVENDLKLIGRQVNVSSKFVDILFEDKYGYKVIIELKKGVILRKHIAQLLDYEGFFVSSEDPSVRVILIGNHVPENLKRSLNHHGFEWKELKIASLLEFLKKKGG